MSNEDPFFPGGGRGNRTVIKPVSDLRSADRPRPQPPAAPNPASGRGSSQSPSLEQIPAGPGMNLLEGAASRLLSLAAHLRSATSDVDLNALREQISRHLKQFEEDAFRAGYSDEIVRQAHYTLCTFLDEVVLGTPWGGRSRWQENSLLSTFHRETWGGEQVFRIIDRAQRNASGNIDLLEFLYVVLGLGFEGALGAATDGRDQLARVRDSLFESIRNQRPERDPELSVAWRGSNAGRPGLSNYLPPWAIACIGAGLMLLIFIGFSFALNRASDPLLARIAQLDGEALARLEMSARPTAPATETLYETLSRLLADDIQATRIRLERDGQRVIIRIAGDGLFASASPRVEADRLPMIRRIGEALSQVRADVLVTGHSDNLPIRSVRFPSNWHLSEARAESVSSLLSESGADPNRLRHEGRADTQPLAPNDTAEGRARNRRVDIAVAATGEEPA